MITFNLTKDQVYTLYWALGYARDQVASDLHLGEMDDDEANALQQRINDLTSLHQLIYDLDEEYAEGKT